MNDLFIPRNMTYITIGICHELYGQGRHLEDTLHKRANLCMKFSIYIEPGRDLASAPTRDQCILGLYVFAMLVVNYKNVISHYVCRNTQLPAED